MKMKTNLNLMLLSSYVLSSIVLVSNSHLEISNVLELLHPENIKTFDRNSHLLGKIKYSIQHRPLFKGMLVYSITWPIGSFIQQKVETEELSVCRMVKFSLYGSLYVAPGLYGWMKLSCFIWPKPTFFSTITKAYVEQLTYGPFSICSFLFIMTLFEGGFMRDGIKEMNEKFFPTWKVSAIVWPIIQTVNYSFIPEKNRVPFIGLCSLLWTIFLTFVKYEQVKENDAEMEDLTTRGEELSFCPLNPINVTQSIEYRSKSIFKYAMKLTGILKKINDGIINRESFRNGRLDHFEHDCKTYSDKKKTKDFALKKSAVKWAPALIQKIEEEKICRICRLNSTKVKEELISPCACRGTLAYIHRTCLEKWLKRSGTTYCELCRYNYAVKVIERYSKIDSIRKWLTDEDNFDDAQDLIVDGVLALTFLPIVFICCYGFTTAYSEIPNVTASNLSLSTFEMKQKLWIVFMLACVATSTVVSYSCWLALRSVHYHRRWSNWTRRHGKLILILDANKKKA